jgi:c-di-AMP phosphodiesterase-like protein
MQKALKFIVPAIVTIVVLGFGGGVYYKQYSAEQKERAERDALNQSFEDFLNQFLKNVHAGMVDYKQERKVLVEATGPRNLSDPAYVEENLRLVETLIPSLRQRMANVIKTFEDAES